MLKIRQRRRQLWQLYQSQGLWGSTIFLLQYFKRHLIRRANYQVWIQWKNLVDWRRYRQAGQTIQQFQYRPRFLILVHPAYSTDEPLQQTIESVRSQLYPDWSLHMIQSSDSSDPLTLEHILTQADKAQCEYVLMISAGDRLAAPALFEVLALINQQPEADWIYSDEDVLTQTGKRSAPFFKPDWSPDYFHEFPYVGNLSVYRVSCLREIADWQLEAKNCDRTSALSLTTPLNPYQLMLSVVEHTQQIYHVPKVLYHRWQQSDSWHPATWVQSHPTEAQAALTAYLQRSASPGWAEPMATPGLFQVRRQLTEQPLISLIIPSAAKTLKTPTGPICLVEQCIRSVQERSTYRNFEIVLVDGHDVADEILEKLGAIAANNLKLVRCREPFNFSQRMNQGIAAAAGDVLLMLNDDVEVLTPNWLELMLELAQQPEIAAVGAKLFYPNQTIQHAGVIIPAGNPSHAFAGVPAADPGYFYSNWVTRNYIAVTAACLMVRRNVFEAVGGFDESFPLNYNDVDLCLKFHQAGYRNTLTPHAQLFHYESATRDKGLNPGELEHFNQRWSQYFAQFGTDPYYNTNLYAYTQHFDAFQ
ncbi:MAG: glycosyltransferase [Thainema sp.]